MSARCCSGGAFDGAPRRSTAAGVRRGKRRCWFRRFPLSAISEPFGGIDVCVRALRSLLKRAVRLASISRRAIVLFCFVRCLYLAVLNNGYSFTETGGIIRSTSKRTIYV